MRRRTTQTLLRGLLLATLALGTAPSHALVKGVTRPPEPVVLDARLSGLDGRPVRFKRDVLGRGATLVSFTFIGCRVQCPISDTYMTLIESELAAKQRPDIRLVTLTIDPDNRPEDLRRFAAQFDPGPSRSFLTGSAQELLPLLDGLGMQFGSVSDHPLFFLVFDRQGRFVARLEEAEATPEKLTSALLSVAR